MLQAKTETQVLDILNGYLRVNPVEEAFVSIIVYNGSEEEKAEKFTKDITNAFMNAPPENKDSILRQYLQITGSTTNIFNVKVLINALIKLVDSHIITAKTLSDKILLCDKLNHENQHFWVECFKAVKAVINQVDYKGVREVMRICRDKVEAFPLSVNVSHVPQLLALEDVVRYIFDRNNCLLPAYFIANEILKPLPLHWKFNKLMVDYIEDFRKIAQMVSIINQCNMLPIVEQFGYPDHMMNSWKLDHNTLKFNFRGSLPYEPELVMEQTKLLRYVLQQSYSREMISVILNVPKQQKQRCSALEDQLVDLIVSAMENTDVNEHAIGCTFNGFDDKLIINEYIWLHLSSHLIYFVLFQFVSFMHIVLALYEKLAEKQLRRGRDHLMWILLQFISGSIQKNPIANFLPMFKLFDLLYPEKEPLKLPDWSKSSSLRQMAPVCTWIHLMKKAVGEKMNTNRPLPIALKNHYDFLQHIIMPNSLMQMTVGSDFRLILICNAYSTNQDYFLRPLNTLVDSLNINSQNVNGAPMPAAPFSIVVLDSLTVHSKMSLIHSLISQMIKQSHTKTSVPTPALVETYARLLVYTEIESIGIKGFLATLLPAVFKHQNWRILHNLLEMFSYRLHHVPTHYRMQLLSHLHSLASLPQTNKMQLNLCFESTALKIITGFGSAEIQPQLSRHFNEKLQGSIASADSEELNRVLILTLARAMHVTGSGDEMQIWCKELLSTIIQNTPHSWASCSLACFPPALAEFFAQNNHPVENKQLLKKAVEEEYRTWTSMTNENDILVHFIRPNANPLFLCLLFKMIWETENITPVAYKILEGINARALSAHLRKLCDYLVGEVVAVNGKDFIHKCVDTISSMMWKYGIVTIDRVVLCLALRPQEGNESQVSFLIIQLLLLKSPDIRTRIQEFSSFNPDHWKQNNWHEKHTNYHSKYPEKFASDESASQPPLPVYFSNVCLRLIPVMDIVIHRYIDSTIQHVHQVLEVILDHLCPIYKFHDRPITYLYNTLSFYERILRDSPSLKRKLVSSITGAFSEIRPANWALSDPYLNFLNAKDPLWSPDLLYYKSLLRRLIEAIDGKAFFNTDWRFNEFPNAPAHALYVTCVELMSLPIAPGILASSLIDVIDKGLFTLCKHNEVDKFLNAVGTVLAALPESYWSVIYDRIQNCLNSPKMLDWKYHYSIFDLCDFKKVCETMCHKNFAVTLAIAHATFHHMNGFKLASMSRYLEEKLKPCVHNENQLVFLCHMFGPFMQRIVQEKPNAVAGIAVLLYEMLEIVDKFHGPSPLTHMDPICDFLYHIKYIHVGNIIKNETEPIIKRLRPALQVRLRFMTHLNLEDIHSDKHSEHFSMGHPQVHHSQQDQGHMTLQQMSQQIPQQLAQQMPTASNINQVQMSLQHQQAQQNVQIQVQSAAASQQLQQLQQQQLQQQQMSQQQGQGLPQQQSMQLQQGQNPNLMGVNAMQQQTNLQHQQAMQQQMQLNPQQQHQLQQMQHQQQQFQLQQLQMQQQQQNLRHN